MGYQELRQELCVVSPLYATTLLVEDDFADVVSLEDFPQCVLYNGL